MFKKKGIVCFLKLIDPCKLTKTSLIYLFWELKVTDKNHQLLNLNAILIF